MGSRNKICYLCGEKYQYCSTCFQDRYKPAFMSVFHDANCNEIFEICTQYNMKKITKEEAKNRLLKCDLSKKDNFKDCIKKDLNEIFKEEHPVRGKRAESNIYDESCGTDCVKNESDKMIKRESMPIKENYSKTNNHKRAHGVVSNKK